VVVAVAMVVVVIVTVARVRLRRPRQRLAARPVAVVARRARRWPTPRSLQSHTPATTWRGDEKTLFSAVIGPEVHGCAGLKSTARS
jgi:hypothetical protein